MPPFCWFGVIIGIIDGVIIGYGVGTVYAYRLVHVYYLHKIFLLVHKLRTILQLCIKKEALIRLRDIDHLLCSLYISLYAIKFLVAGIACRSP